MEILERLGSDHLGDSYPAYELDWLLALEIQKPLGYNHKSIKAPVKCWHGMDDSITPLGASMWMQREMDNFLLYAVEGATHNIHLDLAIVKALFADIVAHNMMTKAANVVPAADPKTETEQAESGATEGEIGQVSMAQSEESTAVDSNQPGLEASQQVWA